MSWRQFFALTAKAGSVFFAVFGLSQVVALLLPGGAEYFKIGIELLKDDPAFPHKGWIVQLAQVAAGLMLTVVPASLLAFAAWWAKSSDRRRQAELAAGLAAQESWGEQALPWVFDRLLAAIADPVAGPAALLQVKTFIAPNLAFLQRRNLEKVLALLENQPSPAGVPTVREQEGLRQPWLGVILVACVGLAALTFFWGILDAVFQLWIGVVPILGLKTSAASIAAGLGIGWSFAALFAIMASGLHRIPREDRRAKKEELRLRLRKAAEPFESWRRRLQDSDSPFAGELNEALATVSEAEENLS
jgi:hypothetical protein